jgi:hypothetical protein
MKKMHYLTIIGLLIIAFGTFLTILGQQIKSDESNKELITTVKEKDEKINSLTNEVQLLRESDELKETKRNEKIKTVASRAGGIIMEGNLFYSTYIGKYDNDVLQILMENDFKKHDLPDKEIIDNVKKVFMSTTMLEPSHVVKKANNKPIMELEYFHSQMTKVYSETNTILQHYGDIDHDLIKQIDDIRSRSKMFVEMIPLLNSVQGGVRDVFEKGVPDQWADFFAYYYLAHHKFDISCKKILNEK